MKQYIIKTTDLYCMTVPDYITDKEAMTKFHDEETFDPPCCGPIFIFRM